MITNTTLKPAQVIRYDGGLWRVEHVNRSRAFIVPLFKRKVTPEDTTFGATGRGVSIGTNSYVEVVEDLERAQTELELAAAERELEAARREMQREAAAPHAAPTPAPAAPASAGGWCLAPGHTALHEPGSVKEAVVAYLKSHAGASTKGVAAGCPHASGGAVAACLDRFRKSGVVIKG